MEALRPVMVTAPSHVTTSAPPRNAASVLMNIHRNAKMEDVIKEYRLLQEDELFTDLTLVTGDGQKKRVHSLVLASTSTFIRDWIQSVFHLQSEFVVVLPDVLGNDLDVLISILYGFDVVVPEDVVGKLYNAADLLAISVDLPFNTNSAPPTSTNSPPLCCWHCNSVFGTLDDLQLHLNTHVGERFKKKTHICQECKKVLPSMWKLRQHLATAHKRQLKPPAAKTTPTNVVQDHLYAEKPVAAAVEKTAANAKPSAVSDHLYSAKRLTRKEVEDKLKRKEKSAQMKKMDHLYSAPSSPTNPGTSEFPSEKAKKRPKMSSSKKQRMEVKTNTKLRQNLAKNDHECAKCGKVFPQPYRLSRHVREVHLKERRHTCKYCDKAFFKLTSMSRHELTHQTHDKWKCPNCQKCFRDESCLKYHCKKNVCEKPSRLRKRKR